jgi:hypothetical protein
MTSLLAHSVSLPTAVFAEKNKRKASAAVSLPEAVSGGWQGEVVGCLPQESGGGYPKDTQA